MAKIYQVQEINVSLQQIMGQPQVLHHIFPLKHEAQLLHRGQGVFTKWDRFVRAGIAQIEGPHHLMDYLNGRDENDEAYRVLLDESKALARQSCCLDMIIKRTVSQSLLGDASLDGVFSGRELYRWIRNELIPHELVDIVALVKKMTFLAEAPLADSESREARIKAQAGVCLDMQEANLDSVIGAIFLRTFDNARCIHYLQSQNHTTDLVDLLQKQTDIGSFIPGFSEAAHGTLATTTTGRGCFRCGSTEHAVAFCVPSNKPHATWGNIKGKFYYMWIAKYGKN